MNTVLKTLLASVALCANALCLCAVAQTSRSPFLPAGGSGANAAVADNTPLEFRGMLESDGVALYGIYDPAKQKSAWVKLNESGRDFVVRSFDPSGNAISVDFQGRQMNLALKAPKIETMTSPPNVVGVNPNFQRPNTNGAGNPPSLNPTSADEAKRLSDVAAEVRRRRQLRMAQPNRGPVPPGSAGSPPAQFR